MTLLQMIAEWRKGCSCSDRPENCSQCTLALIDALERELRKPGANAWGVLDMDGEEFHSVHTSKEDAERAAFGLGTVVPLTSLNSGEARDAARYRWLRDDNAYVPEEQAVRGGESLDELCDAGIDGTLFGGITGEDTE